MLRQPEPVLVVELFPEERSKLLEVLSGLSVEQWQAPTVCSGWTVKDVVAHLLGVELGKISRARDEYHASSPLPGEALGAFLDRINNEWVVAMRRLSHAVLCDLLRVSGQQLVDVFRAMDLYETGPPVTWAGPEPMPVWLDVAREYTERWHHQQHIRGAVGIDGLNDPYFMAPALATLVWSLPESVREAETDEGTVVQVQVTGPSGGDWAVIRERDAWRLYAGTVAEPAARVTLDEEVAWRLFTNGITRAEATKHVQLKGDIDLAQRVLSAVAIIV